MVVTKVEKLEPLPLRKEWMNDLAQAVAFLESLNLAHGDLRPENVLLDRNRLKLSDFDCTAEIGTNYEACMAPYGRILNQNDEGECGTFGFLGPQTEQFALGSLFYLINYGFEVYGDRCLTEDPYEHGPKVVDLLQNMEFPTLDGDPLIDGIIDNCWHGKYGTVSELAAVTESLLNGESDEAGSNGVRSRHKGSDNGGTLLETTTIEPWRMFMGRIIYGIWGGFENWWTWVSQGINGDAATAERADGDCCQEMDQSLLLEEFLSKKEFCKDLEKRGLLHVLSSGEPEELGFSFDWYRHSL